MTSSNSSSSNSGGRQTSRCVGLELLCSVESMRLVSIVHALKIQLLLFIHSYCVAFLLQTATATGVAGADVCS